MKDWEVYDKIAHFANNFYGGRVIAISQDLWINALKDMPGPHKFVICPQFNPGTFWFQNCPVSHPVKVDSIDKLMECFDDRVNLTCQKTPAGMVNKAIGVYFKEYDGPYARRMNKAKRMALGDPQLFELDLDYKPITKESYDGSRTPILHMDEAGMWPSFNPNPKISHIK